MYYIHVLFFMPCVFLKDYEGLGFTVCHIVYILVMQQFKEMYICVHKYVISESSWI